MVQLKNTYCQWKECEHDKEYIRIVITKEKLIYLECTKCNKWDPKEGYILKNVNQNIFNYNVTNNYYNKEDKKELEESILQDHKIFEDEELNRLMISSITGSHMRIAEVLYYLYKGEFNCTKYDTWYNYDNHRWNINGIKELKLKIMKEIGDKYKEIAKYIKRFNNKKMIDDINELIKQIESNILEENIIKSASIIFYNKNKEFEERLDKNKYLIGFKNGVYDLNKEEFREGNPEDYITMTVGYEYKKEYSKNKEELLKFLREIQPNEKEREYMLTYIATTLIGNPLEVFHIFTGKGRNGKTKLADLIKETYGEYYEACLPTMFTKEAPSSANPRADLLSLRGKKILSTSEPDNLQKFNSAFIKSVTGNDTYKCRPLNSNNMIEFKPNVGIIILCNDIPEFSVNDEATWDRCRCINFPTKFVKNPIGENQKKIDTKLSEKINKWKEDFMLILIEYYKKYKKEGINPTEEVMKLTQKQKEETDIYEIYLKEIIEKVENSTEKILRSELYKQFVEWYKMNNANGKVPSNIAFSRELNKKIKVEKITINGLTQEGIMGYEYKKNINKEEEICLFK